MQRKKKEPAPRPNKKKKVSPENQDDDTLAGERWKENLCNHLSFSLLLPPDLVDGSLPVPQAKKVKRTSKVQ